MTNTARKKATPACQIVALALAAALTGIGARDAAAANIAFGVYDPNGNFTNDKGVAIEHLFLPWRDVYLPSLYVADDYARARGRSLLVTLEPWTWNRDERNQPDVLIDELSRGFYDENIEHICATLGELKSPTVVRFAQEMEDTSGQFIWSNWDPETYIKYYRDFVGKCRAVAPNLSFMWSPLGLENLTDYFPGYDVVDVIGVSVFGFQPWEERIVGRSQSFDDIFGPRYERAAAFGLPVMVAELGFSGSAEYVAQWVKDTEGPFPNYPGLIGLVYFNQQEVSPWPNDFGLPNWAVDGRVLTNGNVVN